MRFTVDVGYSPCLIIYPDYCAALPKSDQYEDCAERRFMSHEEVTSASGDIIITCVADIPEAAFFFSVFAKIDILEFQGKILKLQTQYSINTTNQSGYLSKRRRFLLDITILPILI